LEKVQLTLEELTDRRCWSQPRPPETNNPEFQGSR